MTNPKLRFRSADGSLFEDWKSVKVGDIAETCGGGTPATGNASYWGGSIQWLTPTEINTKYVHSSERTITQDGLKNSSAKLLPKGAIVLTTRATLGACSINNFEGDVCTNQGFQSLIGKSSVDSEFLYYLVASKRFQKELEKKASGSTFLEVSPGNLKKIVVALPCKQEQDRIAQFFSTLDEKIGLAERKLTALQTLKSGLIQKIFSQEIRFKREDGSDFPIWEKTFLGKVGNLRGRIGFRGYTRADITNKEEGVVALAPGSISDGHINLEEGTYITRKKYDESTEIKVIKDDILFTKTGSTVGKIGLVDRGDIEATVNPQIALITVNKQQAEAYFVYSYMQSPTAQRYVTAIVVGGAIPTLSQQELKAMPVPLIDHAEQKDIAHLFLHVDKRIRCSKQKLLRLKKMKQAFMQQMFV